MKYASTIQTKTKEAYMIIKTNAEEYPIPSGLNTYSAIGIPTPRITRYLATYYLYHKKPKMLFSLFQ